MVKGKVLILLIVYMVPKLSRVADIHDISVSQPELHVEHCGGYMESFHNSFPRPVAQPDQNPNDCFNSSGSLKFK